MHSWKCPVVQIRTFPECGFSDEKGRKKPPKSSKKKKLANAMVFLIAALLYHPEHWTPKMPYSRQF